MRLSASAERLKERGLLDLAKQVAEEHGVPLDSLLGRGRQRSVSRARHALWYRLYYHSERYFSYPEIGRLVGRDHRTVMSGVSRHAASLPPGEEGRLAIDGALQRAHTARQKAISLLAADLRRIEEGAAELGVSLDELRVDTLVTA